MINLVPTDADLNELYKQMPQASERLKIIILTRMVAERDMEIATLQPEEAETAPKE